MNPLATHGLRSAVRLAVALFLTASVSAAPAMAADSRDTSLFELALVQESSVAEAIEKEDVETLAVISELLTTQVDVTLRLKTAGRPVTDCDLAIQSLTHISLLAGQGLKQSEEVAAILQGGMSTVVRDYGRDMEQCARSLNRDPEQRPDFAKLVKAR